MIYLLCVAIFLMSLIGNFDLAAAAINTPNDATTSLDQTAQPDTVPKVDDTSYCFRFTWLGPAYTPESEYKNATCTDVLKGAKGVPCIGPLVVTNNSNIPDTNYMWDMYKDTPLMVACRLVKGDVCAKYTYFYNGAVENITYLCTKVRIEKEDAVTSGCYLEVNDGREVEVCVCESPSGRIPCNSADQLTLSVVRSALTVLGLTMILYNFSWKTKI